VLIDDKPIGVALNRNLGSPTAPGEAVEAELDRLIERRSRQRDADEESELWKERAAGILRGFYDAKDEIGREVESVEGPHADILTDRQRAEIAYAQKAERAVAKAEECRHEYQDLMEERNEAVRTRTRALREQLFGAQDARVLSRAALASDAELGAMLELAVRADNAELGRAVFAAAEQRGFGDLMNRYFDQMDPEAGELYQEFKAAPSEEDLQCRLADAETLFAAPDASYFAPALGRL
jgi:hypothetical protein